MQSVLTKPVPYYHCWSDLIQPLKGSDNDRSQKAGEKTQQEKAIISFFHNVAFCRSSLFIDAWPIVSPVNNASIVVAVAQKRAVSIPFTIGDSEGVYLKS